MLVVCLITSAIPVAGAAEDYRDWRQTDPRWGSLIMGADSSVGYYGCLVTSVAKLIIQYGSRTQDTFNVGTLVNWLNANNGFLSNGCLIYAKAAEMVGISYNHSHCNTSGNAASLKDTIFSLLDQNYGIVLRVDNGGHYIAVDGEKSLKTGKIYIMDSKSYLPGADILLSDRYSWVSGLHLYKFNRGPLSCEHTSFDSLGVCNNPNCQWKFVPDPVSTTHPVSGKNVVGVYTSTGKWNKKSEPYAAASNIGSLKKNQEAIVTGCVKNAFGNVWYELEGGGYINENNLNYKSTIPFTVKTFTVTSPSGTIETGKAHPVIGVIETSTPIKKITAWVQDSAGNVKMGGKVTYNPNSTKVNIRDTKINNDLVFQRLTEPGDYTLVMEVSDGNTTERKAFPFSAKSASLPNCAVPTISASNADNGKRITLGCSTSGVTMYYTTDGSAPTTGSNQYNGPFIIQKPATIRVLAVRSGYNSSTAENRITVSSTVFNGIQTQQTTKGVCITMAAESGATIYYTLGDSSETKYTGPFYVTSNTVVSAYATKSGKTRSMGFSEDITPQKPDTPQIKLSSGESKVAVGKSVAVQWPADTMASGYDLMLYYEGEMISSVNNMKENVYSFSLDQVGTYSVSVCARNAVGISAESTPITVRAMAPVTVCFVDADLDGEPGATLVQKTVEYGSYLSEVAKPSRRGHDFIGWNKEGQTAVSTNSYKLSPITENTTFSANYEPKTYTVTFRDTEGSVISAKEVRYQNAATPPDYSSHVPTGYSFVGWAVTEAENDSACDYTCVDSDMEVQAVIRWENEELPVTAVIGEATSNGGYRIPVDLYNWPVSASDVYVCVALKTTSGAHQQTVFADRQLVQLEAGTAGKVTKSITFELTYPGTAGTVEVLVLERKADGTTGSAYAKSAQAPIISGTTWSDWSDWSASKPSSKDGRVIESKTQYRYQTKKTTTSTKSSMSGWTRYDSTSKWSSYGNWSNWSTTAVSGSDSCQVQSRNAYLYYYHTCIRCGARMPSTRCIPSEGGCGAAIHENRGDNIEFWDTIPYSQASIISGSNVETLRYIDSDENGRGYAVISKFLIPPPGGEPYTAPQTQFRYRTRSLITTYYYYKWSDWSSWSDNVADASDEKNVQTRIVYRYRDEIPAYETNEDPVTGALHTFWGKLPVDENLSGKAATIMVYQSKNMDANQYQMQYIGQTTIGANNAYEVEFIPKSEPTADTGNFVVALGIEGATGLMNIGVIEAPKRDLQVDFYYVDAIGNHIALSSQTVKEGADADVPEAPERDGYVFLGWNARTTNIIDDCSIEAIYAPKEYTVVFVDWANEAIGFQTAPAGTPIAPPNEPDAEGKTFLGWDVLMEDPNAVITGNMVVTAMYETAEYTVRFLDADGNAINTQVIPHGSMAALPAGPSVPGMVFQGWSTDVMWWNVTSDMDVKPIMAYAETTAAPMANLPEASSGMYEVLELTAEDSATIYYTTDGSTPTVDSNVYTGALELEETTFVQAIAVSEGKNDSDVVSVAFFYDESPSEPEPTEKIVVSTQEIQVKPGDTLDLDIVLQDNPGLAGYLVYVECDRSVFFVRPDENNEENAIPGSICSDGTMMLAPYGFDGWQVLWFNAEEVTENGTLFTLPLEVVDDAEAGTYTFTISYSPENTISSTYEETELSEGAIVAVSESDALYGDANGDGKRNLSDVILIARYLIGLDTIANAYLALADVNGDGKITNLDVIRLSRYLINLETSLR